MAKKPDQVEALLIPINDVFVVDTFVHVFGGEDVKDGEGGVGGPSDSLDGHLQPHVVGLLLFLFGRGGQGADLGPVPDVEFQNVEQLDNLFAGDGLHGPLGLELGRLGAQVLQFVLVNQDLGRYLRGLQTQQQPT